MFGTLVSAINAARPVVVAATPYVVNAAKVSAAVAAINFGTRLTLRGGANYLRRKANQEGVDDIYKAKEANPEMSREEFDSYAAQMPGFRTTTLREKFAFLWDVTWTSGLTGVSTFWATLSFPIYGTAYLMRYTGNIGFWIILRFGRLFGMAPWTEKSYNDRFQTKTKKYYWAVRKPTLGVSERMNTPYVMGTLYEIQRAFFPQLFPDFFTWYDTARKYAQNMNGAEPPNDYKSPVAQTEPVTPTDKETVESETVPVVKTWDSAEVFREKMRREEAGLRVLNNSWDALKTTNLWNEEHLRDEPEETARMVRHHIHRTNRKRIPDAEQAIFTFLLFHVNDDPFVTERFASEFLQQGVHVKTKPGASTGSHAV